MASLDHTRFAKELLALVQAHPSTDERLLARSALMWLAVAQRPLRAHELWIALQVEESKDLEHIEQLLTEAAYTDEAKAAAALKKLLGGLIALTPEAADSNKIYVAFSDPEVRTFLTHLDDYDLPDASRDFGFGTAQAHIFTASVCMIITSVTTLHLARVHDERRASSLVLYAWTNWNTHIALSGVSLANPNAAGLANSMIFNVCTDALVFLLSLSEFVTGPITVSPTDDQVGTVALVKQAQAALERPIFLLSALVKHPAHAETLQQARDTLEASKGNSVLASSVPSETSNLIPLMDQHDVLPSGPRVRSKVEILRIDKALAKSEPLFGEAEKQMVGGFADVARSLRAVSLPLAESPLYEQLLRECDGDWSPLDVLVNLANWMEALAAYPFWGELRSTASYNPLEITDPNDPNYHAASLVLSRIRKVGSSSSSKEKGQPDQKIPTSSTLPRQAPAGISQSRMSAARAVYKLKAMGKNPKLGSGFVINDLRLISQRTSSFATIAPHLASDPFVHLYPFIPNSVRRYYRKTVNALNPFVSRVRSSSTANSVDQMAAGAFAQLDSERWEAVKTALVTEGYRLALFYFLTAILLHHMRQMFAPWLGTFIYYTPLEDLRLALSSPHVFLEESLSISWLWFCFSTLLKTGVDTVAAFFVGFLQGVVQFDQNPDTGAWPHQDPYWGKFFRASNVIFLVWALLGIEYFLTRSISTVAFFYAYVKLLLFGGEAEHIALGATLKEHWPMALMNVYMILWYARNALWGIFFQAVVDLVTGKPGMFALIVAIVGTITGIVRYRGVVYIALEVGGMFVAGGLALVTVALLAVEFWSDPLGVSASTAALRRRANRARSALPTGAMARAGILSGRAALPVVRPPRAVEEVGVEEVRELVAQ